MPSIDDLDQGRQDALAADKEHVATLYAQRHEIDLGVR